MMLGEGVWVSGVCVAARGRECTAWGAQPPHMPGSAKTASWEGGQTDIVCPGRA